jgi:hypothetical protein
MYKSLLLLLCGLLCCAYASADSPAPAASPSFRLRASVVVAVEGGPLVIKVTLRNCGSRPQVLGVFPPGPYSHVENPPKEWGWGLLGRGYNGPTYGCETLKPGEEWTEIQYLHHRYVNLSPRRVNLTLGWTVYSYDPFECIASLQTTIPVVILPANAENLSALRRRLERRLQAPRPSSEDINDIQNILYRTAHASLLPVATKVLEKPCPDGGFRRTFSFLESCSEYHRELDSELIRILKDPQYPNRRQIFDHWNGRKKPLPADQLAELAQIDHIWTRVMTYAYFPGRCEKPWIAALLGDLEHLPKPIPGDRMVRLLRELDSEDFTAREKAMAELADYGEGAEKQLKQALQGPLSPEVTRRVRRLLEGIESAKASPEWKPMVEHLQTMGNGREARAVLTALSKGPPDAALTKAAKAALQVRDRLFPKER